MRQNNVEIGSTYLTRVGGALRRVVVTDRLDRIDFLTGRRAVKFAVKCADTGRPLPKARSAAALRVERLAADVAADSDLAAAVRETPHTDRCEPVIDRLRRIVAEHQAARVDGVLVDGFSASVVVRVFDRLNAKNQAKMAALPVRRMIHVALEVAAR